MEIVVDFQALNVVCKILQIISPKNISPIFFKVALVVALEHNLHPLCFHQLKRTRQNHRHQHVWMSERN